MIFSKSIFHYPGYFNAESFCNLAVATRNGKTLVICGEHPDNPGTSVTNCAEKIAALLCNTHPEINPARLTWIEYYPKRGPKHDPFPPSFDLVTFERIWGSPTVIERPSWKHLKEQEALDLCRDFFGDLVEAPEVARKMLEAPAEAAA